MTTGRINQVTKRERFSLSSLSSIIPRFIISSTFIHTNESQILKKSFPSQYPPPSKSIIPFKKKQDSFSLLILHEKNKTETKKERIPL